MSERPDDDISPLPDDVQNPGSDRPLDDDDDADTEFPNDDAPKPI